MQKSKKFKFRWGIDINRSIKSTLEKQIEENNLAPSYLFYGPGPKNKTARILAKILLCESSKKPCRGRCCQMFEQGINPDFIIIKKQKNDTQIKIERIREVKRSASMKSKKRVILILNAELLSLEAANAILKILEEPSNNTVFILTSKNVKGLIPTIISRCQGIYLAGEEDINPNHGREMRTKEFIESDLIRRFQLAREVAEIKGEAINFMNRLELILRLKMLNETKLSEKKVVACEIKKITGHRLLLKENVSARLILEDLSLRLKKRD